MRRLLIVLLAAVMVAVGAMGSATAKEEEPVSVVGPFAIGSAEGDAFAAELAAFGAKKNVPIVYEQYFGIDDLVARLESADPPEVIVTPQPGLLPEVADELVHLDEFIKAKQLRDTFGSYLIDLTTVDGAVLGAPIKLDLKTLVWYQPAAFEAAGYTTPSTFDELVALSDHMVADGRVPWCNYMESGSATGWVGTDWVEDLLLGTEGPAVYDQWVDHTIVFQDPRVEQAFERYQLMIDTAGYVFDRANMLNFWFFFNAVPLGAGDCMMHRQATFFAFAISEFGFDIDDFATFKFPAVDPAFEDVAMGGASYVAATDRGANVEKVVEYLLSKKFGEEAAASSGVWLMAHAEFDGKYYPNDLIRSWGDITTAAIETDQFRLDASDLMPPEVGAGTFWFGIADLVAGVLTIPDVLSDIDNSWPR